jgi:hypothetical protein
VEITDFTRYPIGIENHSSAPVTAAGGSVEARPYEGQLLPETQITATLRPLDGADADLDSELRHFGLVFDAFRYEDDKANREVIKQRISEIHEHVVCRVGLHRAYTLFREIMAGPRGSST